MCHETKSGRILGLLALASLFAAVALPLALAAVMIFSTTPQPAAMTPPAVLASDDPPTELMGWAGEEAAHEAYEQLAQSLPPIELDPEDVAQSQGKIVCLWHFTRLIHRGQHLPAYRQQVGDCVSFGTANAVMYSMATRIAVQGGKGKFEPLFQPYIYGYSRVQIGRGRIRGDGSTGAWAASACKDGGVLSRSEPGCPSYSGQLAREWGSRGVPEQWVEIARKTRPDVRHVSRWEDACACISNGWAISVCSGQGFKMSAAERNGRMEGVPSGSWAHCMAFVGYDDRPGREALYCLNSWGPTAHGNPERYAALDGAPPGGFWVDKRTADRMLGQGDSYAYSFDGFRGQSLFPVGEHDERNSSNAFFDSLEPDFSGSGGGTQELPGRNHIPGDNGSAPGPRSSQHAASIVPGWVQVRSLQVLSVRWAVRANACRAGQRRSLQTSQANRHRLRGRSDLQLQRGQTHCSCGAQGSCSVCGAIV